LTICNFFPRLIHRFTHGNAPYSLHLDSFPGIPPCPFHFPFDSHPGPIDEAVNDAKNLHRALFLFLYCKDNPITRSVVSVLQRPAIADEIRDFFVFLPLDVTWPEGWHIAASLEFTHMPLIAMVRPRGTSLAESKIFVTYQGLVGESTLLSSMSVEHQDRNPDTAIIQTQDEEYDQAVIMHQESERVAREAAECREAELESRKCFVEQEFERIPRPDDTADTVTIRFQFPDGTSRTVKFSRKGSLKWIFAYVRKMVFPKEFSLLTGFPQARMEETDEPVQGTFPEKQYVVYVELDDD
jgi:hypothetical protein